LPIKPQFVAALAAAVLGSAHAAWSDELTSAPGSSQNETVDANAYPWTAIAKLNNGIGGACTAVLIAPDVALTAAHCLYNRASKRFLPAESFHLVFGYQQNGFRRHSRITAYHVSDKYDPSNPYRSLAHDWALLSIEPAKTKADVLLPPGQSTPLPLETNLMTVGYSHLVPYAMTADRQCKLMGRSRDREFLFDTCSAPAGYSGGPVLAVSANNRKARLLGIHVATQALPNMTVAIAISMESIWPEIKSCVEVGRCDFDVIAEAADPPASEILAVQKAKIPVVTEYPCDFTVADCKTIMTGR
jgi:protease YdgD